MPRDRRSVTGIRLGALEARFGLTRVVSFEEAIDHFPTVRLESVVADVVRPDDGADRFLETGEVQHPLVEGGHGPVESFCEGISQFGMVEELLVAESHEVTGPVPLRCPTEVDHPQFTVVDEPVAWLVVAVGERHQRRFVDHLVDLSLERTEDWAREQAYGFRQVGAYRGDLGGHVCCRYLPWHEEPGEQGAGLKVRVGIPLRRGSLHPGSGKVPGEQDAVIDGAVDQRRNPTAKADQAALVCGDLAFDVMAGQACFDDEISSPRLHLQHRRVLQGPGAVHHQLIPR